MDELISRQGLLEKFEQWQETEDYSNDEWNLLVDVLSVIKSMPPATQLITNLAEVGKDVPDINVGELISRQAAIDEGMSYINGDCFCDKEDFAKYIEFIEQLPPAEPKRGKWIYGEDTMADCVDGYRCDQCGFFVPWDYQHKSIDYIKDYNFCPNCGADMRGERNEHLNS